MNIERFEKAAFVVVGKKGSTLDGAGFIQRLWDDANSHFGEVQHLAKRDEKGKIGSTSSIETQLLQPLYRKIHITFSSLWIGKIMNRTNQRCTTNTSSMRVAQYRKNPNASIYFCDKRFFRGVMLVGHMEVLEDPASKEMI